VARDNDSNWIKPTDEFVNQTDNASDYLQVIARAVWKPGVVGDENQIKMRQQLFD